MWGFDVDKAHRVWGCIYSSSKLKNGTTVYAIQPSTIPLVSLLHKMSCTHGRIFTSPSLGGLISQVIALIPFKVEEAPTVLQCYPLLGHETASDSFEPYPDLAGKFGPAICTRAEAPNSRRPSRRQLFALLFRATSVALYPPTTLMDNLTPITIARTNIAMKNTQRYDDDARRRADLRGVFGAARAADHHVRGWLARDQGGRCPRAQGYQHRIYVWRHRDVGARSALELSEGMNMRWVPQGDGSFELRFLDTQAHTMSIVNLLDVGLRKERSVDAASYKDRAVEDCWRLDDVLILASGENMVPAPLESVIKSSSLMSGAVVLERGWNQVDVLFEPAIPVFDVVELIYRWEKSTTFLRIFKDMSLVTAEDKLSLRVAKKAAVKLYDGKSTHYKKRSSSAQKAETRLHRLPGPRSTWKFGWGASRMSTPSLPPTPTLIPFPQGFDSMTFLRNRIMDALRPSSDRQVSKAVHIINQNVVFSHPTIKQLVSGDEVGPSLATPAIEQMIEKYSAELSEVHKSAGAIGSSGYTRTGLTQAQLRFRIGRKIIPR
ncbi:hypothetical protein HWV62_18142 [Athelia sp. TMB]|nr:hypothetical protein HWV62_18142 [Athelia sp. TMB]